MMENTRRLNSVIQGCKSLFTDPNYADFGVIGSMLVVFYNAQGRLCIQILHNNNFLVNEFISKIENDTLYKQNFNNVTFNPFKHRFQSMIIDMIPRGSQIVAWKKLSQNHGEAVIRNMEDKEETSEGIYLNVEWTSTIF